MKPAKKAAKKTAKQAIAKKAKVAEKKGTNRIVAEPAKKRAKRTEGAEHIKPTLNYNQVEALARLSGVAQDTASNLCPAGTKLDTFQKSTLAPLVKDGLVLKDDSNKKAITYSLNRKVVSNSKELAKMLTHVPTEPTTAITVGFLGGLTWGGSAAAQKRDLWVNVRFGRAAGAVLKRLLACGAVGMVRDNDKAPKRFYRAAPVLRSTPVNRKEEKTDPLLD